MRHGAEILYAAYSPIGDRLVTCSLDHTAILWDLDGRKLFELRGHTGAVSAAAFSSDGSRLVTCSFDCTARVWNVLDGQPLYQLQGHRHTLWAAAYSSDGEFILTGSLDHQPRLWTGDGFPVDVLRGQKLGQVFQTLSFLPASDGAARMLTTSQDGSVRIWDAWATPLPLLSGLHGMSLSSAFSPDGMLVATGGQSVVRLWTRRGTLIRELHCGFGGVDALAFSRDGRQLAAGCWDRRLFIWNLKEGGEPVGEPITSLLDGAVWGVEFVPDQSLLVVACLEGPVSVWTASGRRVRSFTKGPTAVRLALSPDGTKVLTGHEDGVARLWNLEGDLLQVFPGHRGFISSVAFHPNRNEILTSGRDGRVIRWDFDASPPKPLAIMFVPEELPTWSAFSPTGDSIASGHYDGIARLWTLDGRLIAELPGHSAPVNHVVYSPDGSRLLTSSADGTCRFWFVHTEDLLKYAHRLDVGTLTDEERIRYSDLLGESYASRGTSIVEPGDATTCNSLAWSMVEPGSHAGRVGAAQAVALADRAVLLSGNAEPGILRTLGVARCRAGRFQEAVDALEKAEAMLIKSASPRSAVDRAFLAIALHHLGLASEATTSLETARTLLRAAPDEPYASEAVAESERVIGAEETTPPRDSVKR